MHSGEYPPLHYINVNVTTFTAILNNNRYDYRKYNIEYLQLLSKKIRNWFIQTRCLITFANDFILKRTYFTHAIIGKFDMSFSIQKYIVQFKITVHNTWK